MIATNQFGVTKIFPYLWSRGEGSKGGCHPCLQCSEVSVVTPAGGEGETRISIAGGEQPRWRGDVKEVFFVGSDGKIMAVAVKATTGSKLSFEPETPQPLFEAHLVSTVFPYFQYDVTADGKRFLLATTRGGSASTSPLTAVVNWDAGLKK
jgi:hypothetical protein